MTENELIHFGVPGMKWGVRKQKTSNSYEQRISKHEQAKQKLISKYSKPSKRHPDRIVTSRAVAGKIRKHNRIINNNKKALQRNNEKKNYNIVNNRIKKTGVGTRQLVSYETGKLSNKKVKKYLGKDISVNQVSDYMKRRNRQAAAASFISAAAGASLAAILASKGLI